MTVAEQAHRYRLTSCEKITPAATLTSGKALQINPVALREEDAVMAKLEYGDEASRLVDEINNVPDTIGRRQAILRALNLKTGERVLDIGSGPGHQALEMSPMVGPLGKVDGMDISESMLQIARTRCDGVSNI